VLSRWFVRNYLQINAAITQAVAIGPSLYEYEFDLNDKIVVTEDTLKILGVILDSKLNFKAHIRVQLGKACAKASALRRLRKFISKDVMVRLYKVYVPPHLEYCCPLFLSVGNVEASKMESTNYYILRSILGYSKTVSYDTLLRLADIKSLEQRREFQSWFCCTSACATREHLISVNFSILRMFRIIYVGLAQGWNSLIMLFQYGMDA